MTKKVFFCSNSNRYIEFMDVQGKYPSTCPYNGECDECGYLKEIVPSKHYFRKKMILQDFFKVQEYLEKRKGGE